jgi:hypothetical protein
MTQWTDYAVDMDPRVSQILDVFARETATDRASLRPEATIEELGIASLDLTLAISNLNRSSISRFPTAAQSLKIILTLHRRAEPCVGSADPRPSYSRCAGDGTTF